jgi:hypothetical protein
MCKHTTRPERQLAHNPACSLCSATEGVDARARTEVCVTPAAADTFHDLLGKEILHALWMSCGGDGDGGVVSCDATTETTSSCNVFMVDVLS